MPTPSSFKDLSVTFKKHPVTDDLVTVKDKSAIVQSISNLLQTNKGERPFQPQLGANIREALFEPLDYATAGILKGAIRDVLNQYEPRIRINRIQCIPNIMLNAFEVELFYTQVGRSDEVQAVEFVLERTR